MPAALALLLLLTLLSTALPNQVPPILKLERAFPVNNNTDLSHLKALDNARHGRLLGSVVDFPVYGNVNNVGLYFTRIQLGTPPREFHVQIDSGSDALWVDCRGCRGCPRTTGLNIWLSFYDPAMSTTSAYVRCADKKCSAVEQYSDSSCSVDTNRCSYGLRYGDGSTASGYYVQDLINLITIDNSSRITNTSASIMFGCSTSQTGAQNTTAVDGIFGFGRKGSSVISQLASQGIAPRAFSHCLKGSHVGGGILVLGEVVEPNMVYSPLMPGGISVNQQILPIDSTLFSTSDNNQGAIIDSGTTLVYLPDEAYDIFVNAISEAVAQYTHPVMVEELICYTIIGSVDKIFPPVSLNFAGGASMFLKPGGYLLLHNRFGDTQLWCIGFQKAISPGMTLVGDLALKDKIIVYDLELQRIGWADYDCSSPVNVSTTRTGQHEYVTARQISKGWITQTAPHMLIASSILIFLIQTLFSTFPSL